MRGVEGRRSIQRSLVTRRAGAITLASILAGCGAYFQGSASSLAVDVEPGRTILMNVMTLEARPGDVVRLMEVRVEPAGGSAQFFVEPLGRSPGEAIGAVYPDSLLGGVPAEERLIPLDGYEFSSQDGMVGVILAASFEEAGTYEVRDVELRYRVNGRPAAQRVAFSARLCVTEDVVAGCAPWASASPVSWRMEERT